MPRPSGSPTAWPSPAATATSTTTSGRAAIVLNRALRRAQQAAADSAPTPRSEAARRRAAGPPPRSTSTTSWRSPPRPAASSRPTRAPGTEARILVAARVGSTRLIDNLPLTLGGRADAPHHDEEQDPPGHRDPGRPALRRVGDRRRGPARRGRPAGRRARAHRRRHQRRPARDLHDRGRARQRRARHQRCRGPPGAPRRHRDPDRLRPDGHRGGQGAASRTWSSSTPTTRSWPPASTRPRPSAARVWSAAT